ncbi:FBD-associated F-box protein At4g10400-like [Humulus lupulus]|uniref:FBD-associated F-box protein At4g10400-like n=1 Tax=Humulus lupulus TaxID=3486 RepID=UPI002B404C79|nr:FBD-associated F-box protein At4g10400-like [Humulus lupulus]
MDTKRVKEHDGTRQLESILSIDRISELPDAVALHILSFIPTIFVVRMSVVSKRWRHMWTLIHVLNFYDRRDLDYLRKPNYNRDRNKFFKLVSKCLKHPFEGTTITKFKLHVDFYGGHHRIDVWLRFPLRKKVKELDINVSPTTSRYSTLPCDLLSLTTLTVLKLCGLYLKIGSPIVSLPSLLVMEFTDIVTNDQTLNNLLLGCPCIEKLKLNCHGLQQPQVLSSNLKSLEFFQGGVQTVKVEAKNLHSFVYYGYNGSCNINLIRCASIRNLKFSNAWLLTDQWFEHLIPQLSHLESLRLHGCYGEYIKIINQQLKDLYIKDSGMRFELLEATIDTPNLVSFHYDGSSLRKISINAPGLVSFRYSSELMSLISLNASNLLNADIVLRGGLEKKTFDVKWYASLIDFLSELNGTKKMTIFSGYERAVIIPNELRAACASPLPDVKHLMYSYGELQYCSREFQQFEPKNNNG